MLCAHVRLSISHKAQECCKVKESISKRAIAIGKKHLNAQATLGTTTSSKIDIFRTTHTSKNDIRITPSRDKET